MSNDARTLAYTDLPAKLGQEPTIPVYYQRVEEGCVTIEAYLPSTCTAEQQAACESAVLKHIGVEAVEIILVTDVPQSAIWLDALRAHEVTDAP